jgi:hypothetical protein
MFTTKRLQFAAIGVTSVLMLGLGFMLSLVAAEPVAAPQAVVAPIEDTLVSKFDEEVKSALVDNHQKQMAALADQKTMLQKLDQSVQQLLVKAKEQPTPPPLPQAEAKPAPKPEPVKATAPGIPDPVRRSSIIWNLNNRWDYSTEELTAHLLAEHNFNSASYSREQLQTVHDNLHNGYNALGDAVVQTAAVQTPAVHYHYTVPQRRGWAFRGAASCAGGNCPTP